MTEPVTVRMPAALLARIDAIALNRSQWFKEAAAEKLERDRSQARRRKRSAWDVLSRFQGTNIEIPRAQGKVRRIEL